MSNDACGCTWEVVVLPSDSQLMYVRLFEDGKMSRYKVSCRVVSRESSKYVDKYGISVGNDVR